MKITKKNKETLNSILKYLGDGEGAIDKMPMRYIVEQKDFTTSAIEALKGKIDAVVVISKNNHLISSEVKKSGFEAPLYFVTVESNKEDFEKTENFKRCVRVETTRLDALLDKATMLLEEIFCEKSGKNIVIYCDAPRLASQLLETRHRLFIASYEMPLTNKNDYRYILSCFACSVWASRKGKGRSISHALFDRPCLRDIAMVNLIKKFPELIYPKELSVMGYSELQIFEIYR